MPEKVLGAAGGAAEVVASGTVAGFDGTEQSISTGITDPTRRLWAVVVPDEDPVPAGPLYAHFTGASFGGWDERISYSMWWDGNAGEWVIRADGFLTATDIKWVVYEI